MAAGDLFEALKAIERVADHPTGLGRRVVLAYAGRALAGATRGHEALVDDEHVPHAALRQMKRRARSGDAASDDDHVGCQRHRVSSLIALIVVRMTVWLLSTR